MSLRGSNVLFKDIFIAEPEKQEKGRSKSLYANRNSCLIDRYCYYGQSTDKNYEAIVRLLSVHFFISEVTVVNVINDNIDVLVQKRKEYKEISLSLLRKKLAEKWPHLIWD